MTIYIKLPYQPEYPTTLEDAASKVATGEIPLDDAFAWHEGLSDWIPLDKLIAPPEAKAATTQAISIKSQDLGSHPAPKKPFLPKSLQTLDHDLRSNTSNPRLRGLRTFLASSLSCVMLFVGGLKLMEVHTRTTQSATAGVMFITGMICATVAVIGLLEVISGKPYVKWVSAWELLPRWKRLIWLSLTVILLILLLIAGCVLYLIFVELLNPGQTKWY